MATTHRLTARSLITIAALCAGTAMCAAQAGAAGGHDTGRPNVDVRERNPVTVPDARSRARARQETRLGAEAEVRTDPVGGGIAWLHAGDRVLTGPAGSAPEAVVLGYLRANVATFGLSESDIANLVLVARAVSPAGITHLRYNQTLDGIPSFDSGISAHVTTDGRLISVSGGAVPGATLPQTTPARPAREGLVSARAHIGGGAVIPPVAATRPGPERVTEFASGERAALRWSPTPDGPRLAWQVIAADQDGHMYDVLVDAGTGFLLRRQNLTQKLGEARSFPDDPVSTPTQQQITMPPAWFDEHAGGTRLWGRYARTYIDPNDQDPAPGAEEGGTRIQIPASAGVPDAPDWLFTQSTAFPSADLCPPSGCTWDAPDRATATTNQFQAATNTHVLASRFAEYLASPPIGFDEASGNFQRVNPGGAGIGGDYVRAEINDGESLNNANMFTPPDGQAPRMQMFLWTEYNNNAADAADVVYHEYVHGLSNRLVVTAGGSSTLGALQARMMGEAWSDFYALDFLVNEGHRVDTAAAAEVILGEYLAGPGGIRAKPIDCPVAPAGVAGCDGHLGAGSVPGGYTYGDIAITQNTSPHNGSEVWAQTLWEIRQTLGRETALSLVTGGMRLSPANPSMLDMRDAILLQAVAARSGVGAADDHYPALWAIFAARGFGASATTPSAQSTTPTEAFDGPAGLRTRETAFTDPYPGGDNDGAVEPGETIQIFQSVWGVGPTDLPGVSGALTSTDPSLEVLQPSATWPLLGRGRVLANTSPFTVRVPAGSCTVARPITIDITSSAGVAQASAAVDPRPGTTGGVDLTQGPSIGVPGVTEQSFTVSGSGSVTDVDLRIDRLDHTWVGDLAIDLEHAGITRRMFTPDPNFDGDDIIGLVLDSEAAQTVSPTGPAPFTGRFRPSAGPAALDAFDGTPVAGEWTLRITDSFPADTGRLVRWGIDSPQQACGTLEIPVAVTGAAGEPGASAATVSGSVTPNGRATGVRFAFGTSPSYGSTNAVQDAGAGNTPVARASELTGLTPGTTDHYRLEAIREGGQVAVAGADRTFTTPSSAAPTPVAPAPAGPEAVSAIRRARVKLARVGRTTRSRATLILTTTWPGRATVALTRTAPGIRRGRACVAVPRRRPVSARPCARQVRVLRSVRAIRAAGTHRIALGTRGLTPGRYAVTATLTSAARVTPPVRRGFIVR